MAELSLEEAEREIEGSNEDSTFLKYVWYGLLAGSVLFLLIISKGV